MARRRFRQGDLAGAYRSTPHLIVGGPGQGYVEANANGVLELHTTGAGAITLTLELTGSTGTFVRRSVDIAVSDG